MEVVMVDVVLAVQFALVAQLLAEPQVEALLVAQNDSAELTKTSFPILLVASQVKILLRDRVGNRQSRK